MFEDAKSADNRAYGEAWKSMIEEDRVAALAKIEMPVLLVWGEKDEIFPAAEQAILRKALSSGDVGLLDESAKRSRSREQVETDSVAPQLWRGHTNRPPWGPRGLPARRTRASGRTQRSAPTRSTLLWKRSTSILAAASSRGPRPWHGGVRGMPRRRPGGGRN